MTSSQPMKTIKKEGSNDNSYGESSSSRPNVSGSNSGSGGSGKKIPLKQDMSPSLSPTSCSSGTIINSSLPHRPPSSDVDMMDKNKQNNGGSRSKKEKNRNTPIPLYAGEQQKSKAQHIENTPGQSKDNNPVDIHVVSSTGLATTTNNSKKINTGEKEKLSQMQQIPKKRRTDDSNGNSLSSRPPSSIKSIEKKQMNRDDGTTTKILEKKDISTASSNSTSNSRQGTPESLPALVRENEDQKQTDDINFPIKPIISPGMTTPGGESSKREKILATGSISKTTTESVVGNDDNNRSSMCSSSTNAEKITIDDPRRRQIIALIKHRKLLVERMIQCRRASEGRMKLIRKRRKATNSSSSATSLPSSSLDALNSPTSSKNGDGGFSSKQQKDVDNKDKTGTTSLKQSDNSTKTDSITNDTPEKDTSGDEVEAFRQLTKVALSVVKKRPAMASTEPKRSPSVRSRVSSKKHAGGGGVNNSTSFDNGNSSSTSAAAMRRSSSMPSLPDPALSQSQPGVVAAMPLHAVAVQGTPKNPAINSNHSSPHSSHYNNLRQTTPQHPGVISYPPVGSGTTTPGIIRNSNTPGPPTVLSGTTAIHNSQIIGTTSSSTSPSSSYHISASSAPIPKKNSSSKRPITPGGATTPPPSNQALSMIPSSSNNSTTKSSKLSLSRSQSQNSQSSFKLKKVNNNNNNNSQSGLKNSITKYASGLVENSFPSKTSLSSSQILSHKPLKPVKRPEVIALRERHKQLMSKLINLQTTNHKQQQQQRHSPPPPPPSSKTTPSSSSSSHRRYGPISTYHHHHNTNDARLAPLRLPSRRKTQWDYLLEEMRWMATDFIEERKWKLATSKTISYVMTTSQRNAILLEGIHAKRTNNGAAAAGEACPPVGGVGSGQKIKGCNPKASDLQQSRAVAKRISAIVSEHWASITDVGALADEGAIVFHTKQRLMEEQEEETRASEDKKTATSNGVDKDEVMAPPPPEEQKRNDKVSDNKTLKNPPPPPNTTTKTSSTPRPTESTSTSRLTYDFSSSYSPPPLLDQDTDDTPPTNISLSIQEASAAAQTIKSKQQRGGGSIDDTTQLYHNCGLELRETQLKAIRYVDSLWSMEEGKWGAIVTGGVGCGKTIAMGGLIWKYREMGAQLVLCTPANLIRWRHELRRFIGLNVLTYGRQGGAYDRSSLPSSSSPSKQPQVASTSVSHHDFSKNDVILCDLASLQSIDSLGMETESTEDSVLFKTQWASVIVDARFPSSFIERSLTNGPSSSSTDYHVAAPPQLSSSQWWRRLLETLPGKKRRLLLEGGWGYIDPSSSKQPGVHPRYRHGQYDDIESLARRVIFIHPKSATESYAPRAISSWAKKEVQVVVKGEKSEQQRGDVTNEIREVLRAAVDPFRIAVERLGWEERVQHTSPRLVSESITSCGDSKDDNATSSSEMTNVVSPTKSTLAKHPTWQHILCPLTPTQRQSYTLTASSLRGVFSSTTSSSSPSIAPALLRLRQVCLHSDINNLSRRKRRRQQSDIDVAQDMITGSGKLRELSILLRELGVNGMVTLHHDNKNELIHCDSSSETTTPTTTTPPPKKVLILASLPSAHALLHTFLTNCGIPHEHLTSPPSHDNNLTTIAATYASSQRSLARFSSSSSDNKTNVLLASPVTVGGSHGGIAAMADVIVSVDEDWSGRGERLMEAIVDRVVMMRGGGGVRLVKLVSEGTCEERFLNEEGFEEQPKVTTEEASCDDKTTTEPITKPPSNLYLQTDVNGYITAAIDPSTGQPRLVLGRKVLKFRGRDLSWVMQATIPRDYVSGGVSRFLTRKEDVKMGDADKKTEIGGEVKDVTMTEGDGKDQEEAKKDTSTDAIVSSSNDNSEEDNEQNLQLGLTLAQAESQACPLIHSTTPLSTPHDLQLHCAIIPPYGSQFPYTLVNRRDISSLPVRTYCERFGRTLLTESSPINTTPDDDTEVNNQPSDKELAEAWHKCGLGCSPSDQASILLTYSKYTPDEPPRKKSIDTTPGDDNPKKKKRPKLPSSPAQLPRRSNFYAATYSSVRSAKIPPFRDGNMGFEPVLYTPPMFPGLLMGYANQKKAPPPSSEPAPPVEGITPPPPAPPPVKNKKKKKEKQQQQQNHHLPVVIPPTTPLDIDDLPHDFFDPTSSNSPLLDFDLTDDLAALNDAVVTLDVPTTPAAGAASHQHPADQFLSDLNPLDLEKSEGLEESCLTNDDALDGIDINFDMDGEMFGDDGGDGGLVEGGVMEEVVPMDIEPVGVNDVTLTAAIAPPVEEPSPQQDDEQQQPLIEDYGLLGPGLLPSNQSSLLLLSTTPVETTSYRFWHDPFDGSLPFDPNDYDEGIMSTGRNYCDNFSLFLDNMLLYVKKRSSSGVMMMGSGKEKSGKKVSSSKKQKKHHSDGGSFLSSTSTHHSTDITKSGSLIGASSTSGSTSLKSPKSSSSSGTKFITEAAKGARANARVAAIRLRSKIAQDVNEAFDRRSAAAGAGVPLLFNDDVTKKGDEKEAKTTKDKSSNPPPTTTTTIELIPFVTQLLHPTNPHQKIMEHAAHQRRLLSQSTTHPQNVDFGPFSAGYLSHPMSGLSPPIRPIGIGLPLGVKLTHREDDFESEPWTKQEDEVLKDSAKRWDGNWYVVSRAVTNAGRFLVGREEWDEIDRGEDVVPEVSKVNRSARQCKERWLSFGLGEIKPTEESSVRRRRDGDRGSRVETEGRGMLLPRGQSTPPSPAALANVPTSATHLYKSRFEIIKLASIKRLHPPTAIPGCACQDKPVRVQPHPSHVQVVQASVAAVNAGGQQEMWPLQLLDLADKRRHLLNQPQTNAERQGGVTTPMRHVGKHQVQQQQQRGGYMHQQQIQHPIRHAAGVTYPTADSSAVSQPSAAMEQQRKQEMIKQAARAAALAPTQRIPKGVKGASATHHPSAGYATPAVRPVGSANAATTSDTTGTSGGQQQPQNPMGLSPMRVAPPKSTQQGRK